MSTVRCKDASELSRLVAGVFSELRTPSALDLCGADGLVLTGISKDGGKMTIRLPPCCLTLQVDGADELVEEVLHGR